MADVLTYLDMQNRVLRQLDEAGDTDTTRALVQDGLNAANKKRATEERWPFMIWDDPVLINVVAGTQIYALHPEFYRPFYFWNQTTLDYLQQIDEEKLGPLGVDWNNSHDDAKHFTLFGRLPVKAQPPSTGSVLTVTAGNAGDNGKAIQVRGDTANGVTTENIACGASGSIVFTRVLKVTKLNEWVGSMTLSAGATTLLTLFADEYGRSYQGFKLLDIPDQAQVIEYKFYRQPIAMENDHDLPDVPTPFEELLVWDTLLDLAAYNDYSDSVIAYWSRKQADLELALEQAYSDDRAIEMGTNYTTYVPR